MFARFFIHRPVFASVLSIIIVLAGMIAIKILPVEEYPQLTPPRVVVVASYNGADAKTISETVASVLEDAINGIDGMIYMQSSSSSSGEMRLNIYFEIGTDPQEALVNVNNRIRRAEARLPEEVRRLGLDIREIPPNILEVVQFFDPQKEMDIVDLNNYIAINVLDELLRIPGVSNAVLSGRKDYSMRIWIQPDSLQKYNMTMPEVIAAIREQNSQYAAGKIGQRPMETDNPYVYAISTEGRLKTVEEFENIVLRSDSKGSMLRLKDVATIFLGSDNYVFDGFINGVLGAPVLIYAQSGANAIAVADAVNKKIEELAQKFPGSLTYEIPYDTTTFVKISIQEVIKTFVEAIILVALVMYLFLGNFRATLIPMLAVPVSIIGTFAGVLAMGFSINLITLFSLVLAIGIVIDDAIIVIENVERILAEEPELSVKDATQKAMGQIMAPIISSVLVLAAVFIPAVFIEGFIGIIQRQFALSIVISVAISGLVALTLTPALCALMLQKESERKQPWWVVKKFNEFFDFSTRLYTGIIGRSLRHLVLSLAAVGIVIFVIVSLFRIVPTGLVPNEDKGSLMAINVLPPAASIARTIEHATELGAIVKNDKDFEIYGLMAGYDLTSGSLKENASILFMKLNPWEERKDKSQSSFAIAERFNRMFASNRKGLTFVVNPPPIRGLSVTGGFEFFAQNLTGKSYAQIESDMRNLSVKANQRPELQMVRTTLNTNFPQYDLVLKRDKIKMLGVALSDLFTTINSTIGTYYVNDFNMQGKTYKVNLRADASYRDSVEAFRNIFVKSRTTGDMIPLNSLVHLEKSLGPDSVDRFNAFPAAKIMGEPAPGYTSGEAIKVVAEVFHELFSEQEYNIGWTGTAYQEIQVTGTGTIAFIFGVIFVYLILAAQYERWIMPVAVLTAIPFAVFGSLLFTWARGLNNDIYFQLGLLLLTALAAKTAILLVEFAMEEHKRGKSLFEATIAAAKIRFRPICMTALTFTLGVFPLVVSTGVGAASRIALGTGVVGGMIAASTLSILFVPLFFYLLENFNEWIREKTGRVRK